MKKLTAGGDESDHDQQSKFGSTIGDWKTSSSHNKWTASLNTANR